jgi:predicted metal-dependent phosphoesterase TrpH
MAIGDFHLHSTASDGVHTPTWVMETAAKNGVRTLALTDHDTTDGFAEAKAAAERLGLRLIPGMVLSSDYGKADVHLLAFGFDVHSVKLQEFLKWLRSGRIDRVYKTVDVLTENGMPIDVKRVFEIAGEASVGRPHVARALVERGFVASVQEAFDLWLGNGKPADIPRDKLSPEDAIKTVRENGGVVFAAHPIFIGEDYPAVLKQFVEWGIEGIETFYKDYDADLVQYHRQLAHEMGVQTSGGSDYHGLGNPGDREIGNIPFPDHEVEAFVAFLESRGVETGK